MPPSPKTKRPRKPGDAPDAPNALVVKGLTPEDFAALDTITERRAAEMAPRGGTTSRNAVVVAALREFIAREVAEAKRAT